MKSKFLQILNALDRELLGLQIHLTKFYENFKIERTNFKRHKF
jgi:hypothetical protein